MYFGYSEIGRFAFVPVGFAIVTATFVALCLVYVVGAVSGRNAAGRFLTWTLRVFGVAVALDAVFAITSGQLGRFVGAFGWSPLIELAVLAALCVGSMGFMASRYVASDPGAEAADSTSSGGAGGAREGSENA